MNHIILLGDSVFDNKSYVGGGKDTITNLREQLAEGDKATLRAVDGSVALDVAEQLTDIPKDATHLVVSVGGNDALDEMYILDRKATSSAEVLCWLSDIAISFQTRYNAMLEAVTKLGLPTTLCTVYYPRFDHAGTQKTAVAALASFNDVIIRQAIRNGLPLIDLRLLCNKPADYANAIEPSERGGEKIAKAILTVIAEHDFKAGRTTAFF